MHLRVSLFSLLLALFLFFRYFRANMSVVVLFAAFVFMGVSIYEAKGNIVFTIVVIGLIILQAYIVILKFKNDPRIVRFQAGCKSSETILHYIVFAIMISILYFVTGLMR
jgi:hypothetical protein